MDNTKKGDFIDLEFTGYSNGEVFDSNISEDLKKINSEAKIKKSIIVIGQGMVVKGLDKALESKEINKEFNITIDSKEGFGERKRELIRTIPLASFREKKVDPHPGMVLALDNSIVKIIAVSGARVTVDFNNPLAGKEIKYKFTIKSIVTEEKIKVESLFQFFFQFLPEYEIKDSIVLIGPKEFESVAKMYSDKFKDILGKPLTFKEKIVKKDDKKEDKTEDKKEEK